MTGDDLEATLTAGGPSDTPSLDGATNSRAGSVSSIGRFEVRGELGSGGMGTVYVAHDPQLNRKVAIKVLNQDIGGAQGTVARERLLREAQSMAQVTHPNVVTVYDVGTIDGHIFIAMEYVRGRNFREWLAHERPDHREIIAGYRDAARGLAAAHSAGLVHRDFKPDNVLMGDDGVVRVVDFGLATALSSEDVGQLRTLSGDPNGLVQTRLTTTGAIMGTPAYMAPEQLEAAPADPRTDQFAWCVALFEALYGHRPFQGETLPQLIYNVLAHQLTEPAAKARAKVPRWVDVAIRRGLARRPEDRFPSMDALLDAIASDPAPSRRGPWITGSVMAGLGITGALLMWSMRDPVDAEPTEAESSWSVSLASGPGRTSPGTGVRLWIGPDTLRFAADHDQPTTEVIALDNGRIPADVIDNHLVLPLEQLLGAGRSEETPNEPDPIILFIDHRVPWTTVEDVLYSSLRVGYLKWAFAVETDDGPRVFLATPPMYAQPSRSMRRRAELHLRVGHESVQVGTQVTRPMEEGTLRALDVGNGACKLPTQAPAAAGLTPIAEINSKLCEFNGVATPVWFSADQDVSWGQVVATLGQVISEHEGFCDGGVVVTSGSGFDDCHSPMPLAEVAGLLERAAEDSTADTQPDPRKIAVSESIRKRMPRLQACYERELAKDPSLEAKLDIDIEISAAGSVTSTKVSSGGEQNAALTSCVGSEVFTWSFEPSLEPTETTFSVTMTGPD